MKKVTIQTQWTDREACERASQALNDLSGVVAAEAHGQQLTAFAGDLLTRQTMMEALHKAGVEGQVIKEEAVTGPALNEG